MKVLKQIRYILFALMVLGCFANFAQNEYGRDLIVLCELLIGLTFLFEAVLVLNDKNKISNIKRAYLFFECIFLSTIFIAYYLFSQDAKMPGRLLGFFAAIFLSLQYLIYAIRTLAKKTKKSGFLAILVFLFIITAILGIVGLTLKLNHWPGANLMMRISFFIALMIIFLGIVKRKYSYDGQMISLKDHLNSLPGKIRLSFCYFTIWSAYITFSIWGLVPSFYTLSVPPAQQKMKQEQSPAADIYWENYAGFIENRRVAAEK